MMSFGTPASRLALLAVIVALATALTAISCLDTRSASGPMDPGISDGEVRFGQSAVLRGPNQDLGRQMRLGIQAAFYEVNQAGGIHGRQLQLKTMDDSYETHSALHTNQWLIEKVRVFALIGAVGTPTSRVAVPLAHDAGVPFLAPLTGAEFLRDPALGNVINLRASYYQETEEMVARLTDDLGITRVAALYQKGPCGQDGLEGVRRALARRGLEPVGSWHYERRAKRASPDIVAADPEAVIVIGDHEQVAAMAKLARRDIDPVVMTFSFGGGQALAEKLGGDGAGVYVTQVVPFPADSSVPVVASYQAALASIAPKGKPGFISLEGYLAGRLAIIGLDACGRDLSRRCFIDALRAAETINLNGFQIEYGPDDNQGSDAVFLTVIGRDEEYRQVEKLAGSH
ncbi:MAG: ABC transporter substrate-binding protein [Chloroflexi bacterium]|nr:ABC transporter substrate-binding protein [Chloroflexota bacterium]